MARNLYRKIPVPRVPPRVSAIPNLDALRDTNPETHQALASVQSSLDSISGYLQQQAGNIGAKPNPPLSVLVSQFFPLRAELHWKPDPSSETPVSYYNIYRSDIVIPPVPPDFSQAKFIAAVAADDQAYLLAGNFYTYSDDLQSSQISGQTIYVLTNGNPQFFYYWLTAVDRFGRESAPQVANSGNPFPVSAVLATALQPQPITGQNILYNGRLAGTAAGVLLVRVAATAATNATPIQVTATAHGMATGDRGVIIGILGNTNANGHWTITKVDNNNFTLNGSAGNAAYTSGGQVYPMIGQPAPTGAKDANGNYAKSPWYLNVGAGTTFNGIVAGSGLVVPAVVNWVVRQDLAAAATHVANSNVSKAGLLFSCTLTPTGVNPSGGIMIVTAFGVDGGSIDTSIGFSQNIAQRLVFPLFVAPSALGAATTVEMNWGISFAAVISECMLHTGYYLAPFTSIEEDTPPGYAHSNMGQSGAQWSNNSAVPPF